MPKISRASFRLWPLLVMSVKKKNKPVSVRYRHLITNSATGLNTTAWVKQRFKAAQLDSSQPSEKPFDGLDKMLLLSWVQKQFSGSDDQPFVLHYWDLRMPNILMDGDNNMIA